MSRRFAAVDLGASSGRVMVAAFGPDNVALREVHRFANRPVRMLARTVWDHHNGSPEAYWRPKLRRVLGALRDHGVVYAPKLFV